MIKMSQEKNCGIAEGLKSLFLVENNSVPFVCDLFFFFFLLNGIKIERLECAFVLGISYISSALLNYHV